MMRIRHTPDWNDPQGLVMVAPLEQDTNPLCLDASTLRLGHGLISASAVFVLSVQSDEPSHHPSQQPQRDDKGKRHL